MTANPYTVRDKAYRLRAQFQHQLQRCEQLGLSWWTDLGTGPRALTFPALRESIRHSIDEAKGLSEIGEETPDHLSWIASLDLERNHYRKTLDDLGAVYNERMDGHKVFTTSEPEIRVGEHAEANDAVAEVGDILMRDYCGVLKLGGAEVKWVECSSCEKPKQAYVEGVKATDGKPIDRWMGITSTSMGAEFQVFPPHGILKLPEGMKNLSQRRLTHLAHEAGHHWVDSIALPKDTIPVSRPQYLSLVRIAFLQDVLFGQEARKRLDLPTFDEYILDMERHKREACVSVNELDSQSQETYGPFSETAINIATEAFCDLYAFLVAGPWYFIDLSHYVHLRHWWFARQNIDHPSDLARLRMGRILVSRQSYRDLAPNPDPWLRHGGYPDWTAAIKDHLDRMEDLEELDFCPTSCGKKPDLPPEEQQLRDLHHSFDERFHFALRQGSYDLKLHRFMQECFEPGVLFLPRLDGKAMEDTYARCVAIAKALRFESRLVVDAAPKYLAAAATLPPIMGRPFPAVMPLYQSIRFASRLRAAGAVDGAGNSRQPLETDAKAG